MKKSNFIVFLFIIVTIVLLYVTSLFERYALQAGAKILWPRRLDHFSVVVAQPGSKVVLRTQWPETHYPTFSYWVKEGETFKNPTFGTSFGVRNDTLFIFASSREKEHIGDCFDCIGIKSIVGTEKSEIQLEYFQADTLKIKLRNAKLSGGFDPSKNKSILLTVDADSSRIDFSKPYPLYFDQIKVRLNRSQLIFSVPRKSSSILSGTLENNSGLYITGQPKVKVEKDATSYSTL